MRLDACVAKNHCSFVSSQNYMLDMWKSIHIRATLFVRCRFCCCCGTCSLHLIAVASMNLCRMINTTYCSLILFFFCYFFFLVAHALLILLLLLLVLRSWTISFAIIANYNKTVDWCTDRSFVLLWAQWCRSIAKAGFKLNL